MSDEGVGFAIFDVVACFLSGRVQRVVVDCICTDNVSMISGVLA